MQDRTGEEEERNYFNGKVKTGTEQSQIPAASGGFQKLMCGGGTLPLHMALGSPYKRDLFCDSADIKNF